MGQIRSFDLSNIDITEANVKFIDDLTNWYVRMNPRRLKREGRKEDCMAALHTLFGVLITMVRIVAPFLT